MVTKSKGKQIKRAVKDADDLIHLFTGKRFKNIAGKAVDLFGDQLVKKVATMFTGVDEPDLPSNNPYAILGVRIDAMDVVVKGAFRSLAREFHPDTGTAPDSKRFQAANEAYNTIVGERLKARSEKECAGKN